MFKKFLFFLMFLALLPACGRKGPIIVPGTVLPQAVSNFGAAEKDGRILLYWDAPQSNTQGRPLTDLAGFTVMRAETPEDGKGCPCNFEKVAYIDLELPKGAVVKGRRVVWAEDTPGLKVGREYLYKVAAVNKDDFPGPESGTVKVALLLPPVAPADLAAKAGNRTVSLSWSKVVKDTGGNTIDDLAGYDLYRTQNEAQWQESPVNNAPVKGESYTDPGLKNNVKYFYRVAALRGREEPYSEGGYSQTVSAIPVKREAPAPPTGLAVAAAPGAVMLSWNISPEQDIAGYKVYRREEGEAGFKALTESPISNITFKDETVTSGKTYYYYVTVVDNAVPPNESGPSEAVKAKVP